MDDHAGDAETRPVPSRRVAEGERDVAPPGHGDEPLTDAPVPPKPKDDDLEVRVPGWFAWWDDYEVSDVTRDAIAGALVAILLIPQAFAYAQLANLPPGVGIAAALVAPVLYALFGGSRYLSIGPVALVSLLVGEALPEDGGRATALLLAGMVGIVLVAIGLLRAGFVFRVFTPPVLTGFVFAAALVIGTSQLGTITGIDLERGVPAVQLWQDVLVQLDQLDLAPFVLGIAVLVALLGGPPLLRRALGVEDGPAWRGHVVRALPLVVLLAAAGVVALLGSPDSIETLGTVALPDLVPQLPSLGDASLGGLALSAVTIALVAAVTSLAIADTLANRDGGGIGRSRELFSLGVANLGPAVMGGYPVGASLSRSAVVADSGGRSPLAAVFGAVLLAVSALLLGPVLEAIPRAALAALIMAAAAKMIKPDEVVTCWRSDRALLVVMAIPFVAVLALGVQLGLLAALVAGAAHLAWQKWSPRAI